MSKDLLGQYKAVLSPLIATVLAFYRLAQFGIMTEVITLKIQSLNEYPLFKKLQSHDSGTYIMLSSTFAWE